MREIRKDIYITMDNDGTPINDTIRVKQYDTISRSIYFHIRDKQGKIIDLTDCKADCSQLTGATNITMDNTTISMANGVYKRHTVSIVDPSTGIIGWTLNSGATDISGRSACEITIYDPIYEQILGTLNFYLDVEPSVRDDEATISTNYYSSLTELFFQIWDMHDVIRQMQLSTYNIDSKIGNLGDDLTGDQVQDGSTVFGVLNRIMYMFTQLDVTGNNSLTGIYGQTLTSLVSQESIEWAIRRMNNTATFGVVLRATYGLNSSVFDGLTTITDVVNSPYAVNEIRANEDCMKMVNNSPTFTAALEMSGTYLDEMTGTNEGINYLKNNFSEMGYVVNSPIWQQAFKRNSSVSYQILENEQWMRAFMNLSNDESYNLFVETSWYNYVWDNDVCWIYMCSIATSSKIYPFELFVNDSNKVNTIMNTANRISHVINYLSACRQMYKDDANYVNIVITTPSYAYSSQNTYPMTIITNIQSYRNAMVNNYNWIRSLLFSNSGSSVFSNNIECVELFVNTPYCIQVMSRLAENETDLSGVVTQIFNSSSYREIIKSILNNDSYFSKEEKSVQVSYYDPYKTYNPSIPGMMVGITINTANWQNILVYAPNSFDGPGYGHKLYSTNSQGTGVSGDYRFDISECVGTSYFTARAAYDNRPGFYEHIGGYFRFYEYISRR